MEKEIVHCHNCGKTGPPGYFHHSKAREPLCSPCFRVYIRIQVYEERKVPGKQSRLSKHSETLVEVRLQAKISAKQIANDIRRAEMARKQHSLEQLQIEIEDLDKQLRALTMTRIHRKYRLICVIPLEQVRVIMCKECILRAEQGQSRRFGRKTGLGNSSQLEIACCSSKCDLM